MFDRKLFMLLLFVCTFQFKLSFAQNYALIMPIATALQRPDTQLVGITDQTANEGSSAIPKMLSSTVEAGTLTIEGYTYKTVIIGDQKWMAENLRVTKYQDGSTILSGLSNSEWFDTSTGAYSVYNNDESNAETYGYLYNWNAVNDNSNLAPAGWHVPADEEWSELVSYLGGNFNAGSKLKKMDTDLWKGSNKRVSNKSGFTAVPGGFREFDGSYLGLGEGAIFWSSTESNSSTAWDRKLTHSNSAVYRGIKSNQTGLSIRLVRDK